MAAESHRFQTHQKHSASHWWIHVGWIHHHFQKYFQITSNSKNVLLVHKLLKNIMQLPEKCKNAVWQKNKLVCCCWQTTCTSRKNKVAPQPSKFTCKCRACSKWVSKTTFDLLVHKHHHQILCITMQSPENNEKYIIPRCYSTILQQIQSCAQRRHCCNQIPRAISSCQGNVAHVHRINGSLYFHTPFCYDSHAAWLRKFPTCSTMHCIYISTSSAKPLWGSAHEVISSQQLQMYRKYLCTLIIPVSSLLSVSAYSLMQKDWTQSAKLKSPCNGFHAVRSIIKEVP